MPNEKVEIPTFSDILSNFIGTNFSDFKEYTQEEIITTVGADGTSVQTVVPLKKMTYVYDMDYIFSWVTFVILLVITLRAFFNTFVSIWRALVWK